MQSTHKMNKSIIISLSTGLERKKTSQQFIPLPM